METTANNLVSIDDVGKLDLRVGTVRQASHHPKADRLMVLEVDLGDHTRQIVAGIRASYEPEALVGQQIVVIANLQPVKLRGVASEGMLLAAGDEQGVSLLQPDRQLEPGTQVR